MLFPVSNPISYYPLETSDSFMRRLSLANHMDFDTTRRAVTQGYGQIPRDALPDVVAARLETLGNLTPGTITRRATAPKALATQAGCHECERVNQPRWLCLQCAKGQIVAQLRHYESMVCLRHRRWTAPGTPATSHVQVDHPDIVAAERVFRDQHLGQCPTNVIVAQKIASDWAGHTDPRIVAERRPELRTTHLPEAIQDAIVTYPEAVALMVVFADSSWLNEVLHHTHAYDDIRAAVDEHVRDALPERPNRAAAMVMRELKPAIARHFHTRGPYRRYHNYPDNPAIPIWHHDVEFTLT